MLGSCVNPVAPGFMIDYKPSRDWCLLVWMDLNKDPMNGPG